MDSVLSPFFSSFPCSRASILCYLTFSYIVDFFYLLNMLLHCYTIDYDFRLGLIDDPKMIRRRYLQSRAFQLDILGIIPMELVALINTTQVTSPRYIAARLSRLIRLWRLDGLVHYLTGNVRLNSNLVGMVRSCMSCLCSPVPPN